EDFTRETYTWKTCRNESCVRPTRSYRGRGHGPAWIAAKITVQGKRLRRSCFDVGRIQVDRHGSAHAPRERHPARSRIRIARGTPSRQNGRAAACLREDRLRQNWRGAPS